MDTKQKRPPSGRGAGKTAPRKVGRSNTVQKRRSKKRPSPDVVYTQPGPFNRNRFLLQLATVVAVVLALLFGMSIFFKVETVTVSGENKYTKWDVRQASGVQVGENLLTISKAKLSSNIRSRLPYVDSVRIGIKLPGTVKIEIKEVDVVYAVETVAGDWMLIRSDGCAVEKITPADAERHTKVLGFRIESAEPGNMIQAAPPPVETTPDGSTVPVTVDGTAMVETAVSILQYLEENGIIGDAKSVNVENLTNLEIWYGDRFQILLGDTTQLSYKVKMVKAAIDNMESYDSGTLDASMTIQPDPEKQYQVIYTPFA